MAYDIVIRNGLIVDGLGNPGYEGDVAIDDDRIAALGNVEKQGTREIDAEGAIVSPGFVDLHTHFDAQVGWDPQLTPASWHGVTTALMGNCGVTFAPVRPGDKALLAGMMESVEDIPRSAILEGLPWDWNSYGEYLNSVERMDPAINLAGLVGHAAARFYIMGERAVDEQASADEIDQIAAVIGQSVKDGAVGLSLNRLEAHRLPDGRCIPGTFASDEEHVAIARAAGAEGGFIQSVISDQLSKELPLIRAQLEAAGTKLLFSAPWLPGDNGASAYQPAIDSMHADGLDITGLTQPRPAGFLSSLKNNMLFGLRFKSSAWRELRSMDFDARLIAIRDAQFRSRLVADAKQMQDAPSIGHTLSSSAYSIPTTKSYWLGSSSGRPDYMQGNELSLMSMATTANEHPAETWLRLMLESNGEGLFHLRFVNEDLAALPGYLKSDWVLPGLGDAGAHVSLVMDAGWTSFFLSHWYRDLGIFTIEEAIQRLTSRPVRVLGFNDRGALQVGLKADINVMDVLSVEERQPQLVHDFPGGAPRLIQRAVGYRNTLVNGVVILENDELTGQRNGRVLRNKV